MSTPATQSSKSLTSIEYKVPVGAPLDRRPRSSRQSSRKEQISRQSSRSRSRSGSPNSRNPSRPRSNVFSNESMTSFRISRRSIMRDDDILSWKSSVRSASSGRGGFDGQNSNTTLILEDEPSSSQAIPSPPASSSLDHSYSKGFDSNCSAGLGIPIIQDDDDNPLYLRHGSSFSTNKNSVNQQSLQQHSGSDENNNSNTVACDDDEDKSSFQWRSKLAVVRIRSGHFVNSIWVQIIMSIFIVANAVILGALTYDSIDGTTQHILETIDLVILVAFTVEIVLHCIYLGLRLFSDSWLTFDFIVILLSWCFLGSSLAVLRSFRIFRVFSLVSRWESLRTLFEAIGSTIPKMASIWASLLIFFYVFCVLFTTVYKGLYEDGYLEADYFGRLDKTFVTLFQFMTLDNWSEVARQVMEFNPWSFLGFFIFIVFSSFFIVNLVVAVICESLISLSRESQGPGAAGPGDEDESLHNNGDFADYKNEQHEDQMVLQDMMRQLLRNQMELVASIRVLQQDVKELKDISIGSPGNGSVDNLSSGEESSFVNEAIVENMKSGEEAFIQEELEETQSS